MTDRPERGEPGEGRGADCPLCEPSAGEAELHSLGPRLVRTATSIVRLAHDQSARGACLVVAARHVREIFELTPHERQGFFDDVAAVGEAVARRFGPDRIDVHSTGEIAAHLHCALVPRYPGIASPGVPLARPRAGSSVDPETESLAAAMRLDLATISSEAEAVLRFDPLGVDDLAALQELCESCADYYHLMTGGPVPRSEAGTLFTMRPETATLQDKFLVAVRQGRRLLGVMDLYRNYPRRRFAWLGLLLLHPDHRGQGRGAAMIRWLLEWARDQGCVRVRVGVADDNLRGIEVLRRHGFEPTGERISRVSGARRLVLLPMERSIG